MNETTGDGNSTYNFKVESNETESYTESNLMSKCELPILIIKKHLQEQNGMKYRDFAQYRRYCTRKLHRLRSLLNLKCGRNKFQKSYLESAKEYKDPKHFLILILLIERCWSFGNELGNIENTSKTKVDNRNRLHGIRKLRKGCKIIDLLVENAQNKCTSRTIVEIKAYQSYILGNYYLKCSNWECAVSELKKSIDIYQQLKLDVSSLISDWKNIFSVLNIPLLSKPECTKIYDNHISELVPLIRLSLYHCKRLGIVIPNDQIVDQFQGSTFGESNSNKKIVYNNNEYSVPASIFEMPLVELEESYSKIKGLIPIDETIKVPNYPSETVIDYYSETLMCSSLLSSKINDEITNITANTGLSPLSGGNSEDWRIFELYVREFNLLVSIERDMILLLQLMEYFSKPEHQINQIFNEKSDKIYTNLNIHKKQISRSPEEGVRVCDLLNFSISEINSSNSLDSNILKLTVLITHAVGNCRSMFLSHFYGRNGKFQEAYLLCDLVRSRSGIKETDYQKIVRDKNGYVERIVLLIKIINNILSNMVHDSFNIYLCCIVNRESSQPKTEWSEERNIHDILKNETLKPHLMPIPVKPIMFDVAFDFIVPPNILNKMRKNGIVNKIFSKASQKLGIFK